MAEPPYAPPHPNRSDGETSPPDRADPSNRAGEVRRDPGGGASGVNQRERGAAGDPPGAGPQDHRPQDR